VDPSFSGLGLAERVPPIGPTEQQAADLGSVIRTIIDYDHAPRLASRFDLDICRHEISLLRCSRATRVSQWVKASSKTSKRSGIKVL
jgi:hypothetical protein